MSVEPTLRVVPVEDGLDCLTLVRERGDSVFLVDGRNPDRILRRHGRVVVSAADVSSLLSSLLLHAATSRANTASNASHRSCAIVFM